MKKIIIINFLNPNSLTMLNTEMLNNKIMLTLTFIILTIIMMIKKNFKNKLINKKMMNNQIMELVWTILPMLTILMISYFSIVTLYLNNEFKLSIMCIKISGNQWFWNYNYTNFSIKFNSYMMLKNKFNFNILETDNKLIIPMNNQINLIVSSMDVIHSWTLPSLNTKIDAIPNQINSSTIMTNKVNIMFGQCSEICGINHSFMPIMVESISLNQFINWIKSMNKK